MTDRHPLAKHIKEPATMLVVKDLAESVAYYRDKLGFIVRESMDNLTLLTLDTMLLYLILESPPTPDKPSVTLTHTNAAENTSVNLVFRVDDCHLVYKELAELGVAFIAPPFQPAWGGWRCFTRDPNGYLIEIEEP